MKIKAKLEMPSVEEMIKATGLEEGGRVQKYIDTFVLYHSEPYEPGKHIHDSGVNATQIGSGKVVWNDPSAEYLYEGKLMVDPFTKVAAFPIRGGKISFRESDGNIEGFVSRKNTQKVIDPRNRDLHFHGGGKRGDHWFDRMIDDEMGELTDGVQRIVNGGK